MRRPAGAQFLCDAKLPAPGRRSPRRGRWCRPPARRVRYARRASRPPVPRTPTLTREGAARSSVQANRGVRRCNRFTVPPLTDNLNCPVVGILLGFAPWIVYWVLVGNVPFTTAVLVALTVAVLSFVIGRLKGNPGRTLEIGAVGTFFVLTILTFMLSQSFMERWMQPLSNAGIFLVALTGVLIGKPFVREFAEMGQPPEVVESEPFGQITTLLTWSWVAAFAGMTVSSSIPPIVYGK